MVKNLPANVGDVKDVSSIPGLGRSPGEGLSNPLQCSCLENLMDIGDWWATVLGVTKSRTNVHSKEAPKWSWGSERRKRREPVQGVVSSVLTEISPQSSPLL